MENWEEEQQNTRGLVQNLVILTDDQDQAIRQYAVLVYHELNLGIVYPEIQAPQFELKPVMFQML